MQEEKSTLTTEGRDRDLLYERAEELSKSLVVMGDQLKEAVERVNVSATNSIASTNQPLGKLVRILNNQLQALTHLDARTDELSAKLDARHGKVCFVASSAAGSLPHM